jgi:hypothetical protein
MSLIATIEELDPGHFKRREYILEDLREKSRALGFFPLPLTWNDVECFWIRLEPNESNKGLKINFTKDTLFDLEIPSILKIYKDVARYDGTK